VSEINLELASCPNLDCPDYQSVGQGNIAVMGSYAKDKRPLLCTVGHAESASLLPLELPCLVPTYHKGLLVISFTMLLKALESALLLDC